LNGTLGRGWLFRTCIRSYQMQNPPPMGHRNTCTGRRLLRVESACPFFLWGGGALLRCAVRWWVCGQTFGRCIIDGRLELETGAVTTAGVTFPAGG
jgi:hypothetical protein